MKPFLLIFLLPTTVTGLFWNSWPFCCGGGYGYGYPPAYPAPIAYQPMAYPSYSPPIISGGSLPAQSQVIWYEKPIPVSGIDRTQLNPINIPGPPPGYRRTISQTTYRSYPVGRPTHISHPIESDPVNGYEPAYSAWNEQPIQAVFKNGPSRFSHPQPAASDSDAQMNNQQEMQTQPEDRMHQSQPENPPENPPEAPLEKKTVEAPTDEEVDQFLKATKEMDKLQQSATKGAGSEAPPTVVSSPFDEIKERKVEAEKSPSPAETWPQTPAEFKASGPKILEPFGEALETTPRPQNQFPAANGVPRTMEEVEERISQPEEEKMRKEATATVNEFNKEKAIASGGHSGVVPTFLVAEAHVSDSEKKTGKKEPFTRVNGKAPKFYIHDKQ